MVNSVRCACDCNLWEITYDTMDEAVYFRCVNCGKEVQPQAGNVIMIYEENPLNQKVSK